MSSAPNHPPPVIPPDLEARFRRRTEDDLFIGPTDNDLASTMAPLSIGGMEAIQTPTDPESISNGSSDLTLVNSGSKRRKEDHEAMLEVWDNIRNQMMSIEDTDYIIQRLEKAADQKIRRTYVGGLPVREVQDTAPILRVGLSFMPGSDRSTVTRMEQTNMIENREPDQKDALWRINTAATLLTEFDVSEDLLIVRKDRSANFAEKARDRLRGRLANAFQSQALVTKGQNMDAITIDSEEVRIVHDLRNHGGEFDVECTLIEVDSQSLLNLILAYRLLIQRGGLIGNLDDTKQHLEQMMEHVRRLFYRSPILFRMTTRERIITSKNTRYGSNNSREFVTVTTSKGIHEIISLSASYFNTLDSDPKAQKFIRPRFLQMLVLLLYFLNDDDLHEIRGFIESTYYFKADRPNLEILFLKVIPLMSINSSIFLRSMIPAFEGWVPREPAPQDYSWYWDTFVCRIMPLGYLLPGTVNSLGRSPSSWVVKWDDYKSSVIFNNLQYGGDPHRGGTSQMRTFNDIPPIEATMDPEDGAQELTVLLTNDERFTIRTADCERIVCLAAGLYPVRQAQGGRHFDLEIRETHLNHGTREAVKAINQLINQINSWLSDSRRRSNGLERLLSRRGKPAMSRLNQCRATGRLTKHTASLGQITLAISYKIDGRKITLSDALRLMAQDNAEIQSVVDYYNGLNDQLPGIRPEFLQAVRRDLHTVVAYLSEAEEVRRRLRDDPSVSDEPIATILQPGANNPLAQAVWFDYKSWGNQRGLNLEARKSIVARVIWLSDVICELALQGHAAQYFVSPLQDVHEGMRHDEVRPGDIAILAGQYMILAEPDEDEMSNDLIMTNYMRITSVEEPVQSARGANRGAGGRGMNRRGVEMSICTFI